jgi:hypothetical protein
MSRRSADPLPGIVAKYDGVCGRCDDPILAGETRVVFHRGAPIHCGCASGADE